MFAQRLLALRGAVTPIRRALLHHSTLRRLKPFELITTNIAPLTGSEKHEGEKLSLHYQQPQTVLQFSYPPKSGIKELLIARHNNRLSEKEPWLNNVVSATVVTHAGKSLPLINALYQRYAKGWYYLTHSFDMLNVRVGYTINCDNPVYRERFHDFVDIVQSVSGTDLSEEQQQAIHQLTEPGNVKGLLVPDLPIEATATTDLSRNMIFQFPLTAKFDSYFPARHQAIPTETPALHHAIAAGDLAKVKSIVTENPHAILSLDPWGREAMDWAVNAGRLNILTYLTKVHMNLWDLPWFEKKKETYYIFVCNKWGNLEQELPQPQKDVDAFLHPDTPKLPLRGELHRLCLERETNSVIEILKQQPDKLNAPDPFGFTPFLLALATGNVELARWLITQGVKVENIEYASHIKENPTHLRPIDFAQTPEVMELILHHRIDPEHYNNRFETAVLLNDLKMAEYMLYYMKKLPTFKGMKMLELALKLSERNGPEMSELILKHINDYVPEGPYDTDTISTIVANKKTSEEAESLRTFLEGEDVAFINVSERLQQVFQDHNAKIEKRRAHKANLPKLTDIRFETEAKTFNARFGFNEQVITLEMKPLSDIKKEERAAIEALVKKAFTIDKDSTPASQRTYFDYAFAVKEDGLSFVNLYRVNGKIVSFKTFEITKSSHPESGIFHLYHAKLAVADPDYSRLGLTELSFVSMVALKQYCENLYGFIKAVPPGYGTCVVPEGIELYPKVTMSHGFIQHIGEVVKDSIYGKTIPTRLRVRDTRLPKALNLNLMWFKHRVKAEDDAMAMIFPVNEYCLHQYQDIFKRYNIDQKTLDDLSRFWKVILTPSFEQTLLNSKL